MSRIHYGDIIILKPVVGPQDFLSGQGILNDEITVRSSEAVEDNLFQICLPRQYSAAQELVDLIEIQREEEAIGILKDSISMRHLEALKVGAKNENRMNELYMKSKMGEEIHYGDAFQLLHIKSRKYLTVIGNEVARYERENIRVCLHPSGSPDSWLVIQPRFKISQSGDPVLSNSEIKLAIAERSTEYLHYSDKVYSNQNREVNSSLEASSWLLILFQSSDDFLDSTNILTSDIISLYDPETLSYLSIFEKPIRIRHLSEKPTPILDPDDETEFETDEDESETESMKEMSPEGEIIMTFCPADNITTNVLWMIESHDLVTGGSIQWKSTSIRLKHMNTGKYLAIGVSSASAAHSSPPASSTRSLYVTSNSTDPGTLLFFAELHSENSYLSNKKVVQIFSSSSHSSHALYLERGTIRDIPGSRAGAESVKAVAGTEKGTGSEKEDSEENCHYVCQITKNKNDSLLLFISREEQITTSNDSGVHVENVQTNEPLDPFVGISIKLFLKGYCENIPFFNHHNHRNQQYSDRLWGSQPPLTFSTGGWAGPAMSTKKSNGPKLDRSDDKLFYFVLEKAINYMKGQSISFGKTGAPSSASSRHPIDEITEEEDDDNAVDEYGEMIRNDQLIFKRQKMFLEQGILDLIVQMLSKILPLFKGEYSPGMTFLNEQLENGSSVLVSPSVESRLSYSSESDYYGNTARSGQSQTQTTKLLIKMALKVAKYLFLLLLNLIKRNHVNQMYLSKYLHVILGWVGINQTAAKVVKEMLNNNLELQLNSIHFDDINIFIEQLTHNNRMNNLYLNMLKSFCSCHGIGIRKNQELVLNALSPHLSRIFIQLSWSSFCSLTDIENYFNNSKYFPERNLLKEDYEILGGSIFEKGLPVLSVTWISWNEYYSIHSLYHSNIITLQEFFSLTRNDQNYQSHMLVHQQSFNLSLGLDKNKNGKKNKTDRLNRRRSIKPPRLNLAKGNSAVSQQVQAVNHKQQVVDYFISQLQLLAELSLGRNISTIINIEKLLSYDSLISILCGISINLSTENSQGSLDENITELYSVCAQLLINLFIDRETESTQQLPCLIKLHRLVSQMGDEKSILPVNDKKIYKYASLQHIISTEIYKLNQLHLSKSSASWGKHIKSLIVMLQKLINMRYYNTKEKLNDIIVPLLSLLDRRNPETDFPSKQLTSTQQSQQIRWEKRVLIFMESIPELAIVMSVVFLSTALSVLQMITQSEAIGYMISDIIILLFFAFEVILRGYVHYMIRKRWITFIGDPFVQLDIGIVLLDVVVMSSESALGSIGQFSSLLRILRLLRLARVARAARLLKKLPNNDQEIRKWILPVRYRTCSMNELDTMTSMITVLIDIQKILDDRNISIFLHYFLQYLQHTSTKKNEIANNEEENKLIEFYFEQTLADINEITITNSVTDDIFLDLVMYVNKDLVQNTLDLLLAHHNRLSTLILNVQRVQLYITRQREEQCSLIHNSLLELDHLIDTYALWGRVDVSDENDDSTVERKSNRMIELLFVLKENCMKESQVFQSGECLFQPDYHTQMILRNYGCWTILRKLLFSFLQIYQENNNNQSGRNTNTNQNAKLIKLILLKCNELLYWYIYQNELNQGEAFSEFNYFLHTIDENIGSHYIFEALFIGNEKLMKMVSESDIVNLLEKICHIGKFPQYLTMLSSITVVDDKNILDNQYKIIKEITSPERLKKILLYFNPINHSEYQKKIKLMLPYQNRKDISLTDLPSSLVYHVELLKVLSGCTTGYYNITTIETKVQMMFSYIDVIDALLDPRTLLIIKVYTAIFFYNCILDVEMTIPGLMFSAKMWELIQLCSQTITSGKDLIRYIERNGWGQSQSGSSKVGETRKGSSYELEFLLGCCRIVYGFFRLYYDPVVFHKEHHPTQNQSTELQLTVAQTDSLIANLFDSIQGIYDLDSPILPFKQKLLLYNCLDYLSRARGISISDCLDKIPFPVQTQNKVKMVDPADLSDFHIQEKLQQYLQLLLSNEKVEEILSKEMNIIVKKISSLPLAANSQSKNTVRYEPMIKKLVDHIRNEIRIVHHLNQKEKYLSPRFTTTAIWIIQIFRKMIENVWGMTIDERDEDGGEEQDKASAHLVNTFNNCGVTTLCLDLIAVGINRELIIESIKLTVAMLFKEGGALAIQKTINNHLNMSPVSSLLSSTKKTTNPITTEYFFLQLRQMIHELIAWHDWKSVSTKKKLLINSGSVSPDHQDKEESLPKDVIAIRMLQLLCEGHFGPNQDILREQKNNSVSINLLDDLVSYLIIVSQTLHEHSSLTAGGIISATILEVIQGPCEGNQNHFTFHTTLIETINTIMRKNLSAGSLVQGMLSPEDQKSMRISECEFKKTCMKILQGLLEGQGKKTHIYDRILSVMHLDVIQMLCNPDPPSLPATSSQNEEHVNVENEKEEIADDEEYAIKVQLGIESLVFLQILCDYKPVLRSELKLLQSDHDQDEKKKKKDSSIDSNDSNNPPKKSHHHEVASVEIMWRGELQRRFFHIPPLCEHITDVIKSNFVEYVDRSSHENKLLDMYRRSKIIYIELLHAKFLTDIKLNKIFSRPNQNRATWITFILACVINLILLFFFKGEDCFQGYSVNNPTNVDCRAPVLSAGPRSVINVLNSLQIVFSSFTLIMFLIVRAPVHYISSYNQGHGVVRSIIATALDPLTMYYFFYVILAIGAIESDYILTFFLLDIVMKNSYAMDVMIAVFTPIKQLTVAIVLSLIVMYIFAMFVFLWMNNAGILQTPRDCQTLYDCWKFSLLFGWSGDFGPTMKQGLNNQWLFYYLFDLAIRFVLLNVVRGITVDTFSELRLLKLERLKDTKETCFICGINKQIFDRDKLSKGFNVHIKKEHNMWNYLYFIIYIWEQDKDDDDGLEQYVRKCIDVNDISWIPSHIALCLSSNSQNKTGSENETITTQSHYANHLNKLENHFLSNINGVQSELQSSLLTIKNLVENPVARIRSEREYTNLVEFSESSDDDKSIQIPEKKRTDLIQRPSTTSNISQQSFGLGPVRPLKKSNTLSNIDKTTHRVKTGQIITLEINEITGLMFPSRVLDSVQCIIRWGNKQSVHLKHITVRCDDPKNPVIVFDPTTIILTEKYEEKKHSHEIITVQIGRDTPCRYVGMVTITYQELVHKSHQRIERNFLAEMKSVACRGTISFHSTTKDCLEFE